MTVFTAIFGNYDYLKEPLVVTPGWQYICFTDQPLTSKVWEIRQITPDDARLAAKEVKITPHHFGIESPSIYIDGSFIINCDLNKFYAKHNGSISFSRNPFRKCAYEEIGACLRNKRDSYSALMEHKARLLKLGVKKNNGMAASGVIMRSGREWEPFCDLWMSEYILGCNRDQVAWAAANHYMREAVSWFEFDYRDSSEMIFIPHNTRPAKQKATVQHWQSKGIQI